MASRNGAVRRVGFIPVFMLHPPPLRWGMLVGRTLRPITAVERTAA